MKKNIKILLEAIFLLFFGFMQANAIESSGLPAFQQQNTVSGVITDASTGDVLPGVSVIVTGTVTGTISDIAGKYSIQVPQGSKTLTFSCVGFESQVINLGTLTQINVAMVTSITGLDEVVVIGYGSVKKRDLTSAVSKMDYQAIEARPLSNVSEAMAGQLSGVRAQNTTGTPGSDLLIRIRGVNTINGSSEPLYVIDGIPRDNMTDINPNDIASLQILKDASASSIYGSRGGNGVVLIETKQGKGKPSFTFDAYYGFQQPTMKLPMMNKNEWVAGQIYVRNVSWLRQGGSMSDPMSSRPSAYQIPAVWLDPTIPSTDWQGAIFQTAPMQSYQLSGSAQSEIGSIYISGGYLSQDGIIFNTYHKRTNFRLNGTLNVGKRIKLGILVAPSYSDREPRLSEGKENAIHHAVLENPLIQLNQATRDWGFPANMGSAYTNPVEQLKYTIDNTKRTMVSNSVWGELEILKGLIFRSQLGFDYANSQYRFFQPGNVTYNTGFVTAGSSSMSNGTDLTLQNTLVFNKTYGVHSINILAGQSIEDHKGYSISARASEWPNEVLSTLNLAKTPTQASTSMARNTGLSFFGRGQYNFMDRYLLNASLRYDGSSRFGANTKWGLFPSVSAGWKINEEGFMKNINWISLLKVRAAWGTAGNNRIGNYDYMALLGIDNYSYNNTVVTGMAPSNIANDDLKWEQTATTDIGLDLSVLKNRIQISLDYYSNKTSNLLYNVPIPNTTGFSSYRTNLGSIRNSGWELDFSSYNTTGVVKWTTEINLSRERNKVLDMGNVTQFITSNWDAQFITKVGGPVSQFYIYRTDGILLPEDFDLDLTGTTPKYVAKVPIFTGQEPGNIKYIDQNKDGKINSSDLEPGGTNLPDFLYGITNIVSWKNFELSSLLQGVVGGKICFLGQRHIDAGLGGNNSYKRWLRQWKPDYEAIYGAGEDPLPRDMGIDWSWDGSTPSQVGVRGNNNDDTRVYDGTFLRIKNITLTYTLPQTMLSRLSIKGTKIYISADNWYTFSNYVSYDPETNSMGNSTTQLGVDYQTYPLSRRIVLGINLTF